VFGDCAMTGAATKTMSAINQSDKREYEFMDTLIPRYRMMLAQSRRQNLARQFVTANFPFD
jgi:ribosomal protein S4